MQKNMALVITSISGPNQPLRIYADECRARGISFIVIGDVASPSDFNLKDCDFWSIARQSTLQFKLAQTIPERHYARKNLGYLLAIRQGAETILETDDDNLPHPGFWSERSPVQEGSVLSEAGWVNVYAYFTDRLIWPRGFPLESIKQVLPQLSSLPPQQRHCPIQQGLADENPDIDAIYRLLLPMPFVFEKKARVILAQNSWCPFNSQNTTWFKSAFPLLYLPSYCSFRMTDIWRSFVAQRICWENRWSVLFHEATVWQERNEHNLLRDFSDEIPGYLNNFRICEALAGLSLSAGERHIPENMIKCYQSLINQGLVDECELSLLNAWLEDIEGCV